MAHAGEVLSEGMGVPSRLQFLDAYGHAGDDHKGQQASRAREEGRTRRNGSVACPGRRATRSVELGEWLARSAIASLLNWLRALPRRLVAGSLEQRQDTVLFGGGHPRRGCRRCKR